MRRLSYLIWIALGVATAVDSGPIAPPEAFSPDEEYSVRLERSALQTADSVNDSTLMIMHKGRVLSRLQRLVL